jgi:hypothetical protein
MRILDQFPIQLAFRPDRWFNPVPLIAIYASYARKKVSIHLSHIIAGLRRLGLDGSSFKGLPKLSIFKTIALYFD